MMGAQDNEDKLDNIGAEVRKMAEYRAQLDREREQLLAQNAQNARKRRMQYSDSEDEEEEGDEEEDSSSEEEDRRRKKDKKKKDKKSSGGKKEKKSKKDKSRKVCTLPLFILLFLFSPFRLLYLFDNRSRKRRSAPTVLIVTAHIAEARGREPCPGSGQGRVCRVEMSPLKPY